MGVCILSISVSAADWPVQLTNKSVVSSFSECVFLDPSREIDTAFPHTGIDIPASPGVQCIALEDLKFRTLKKSKHGNSFDLYFSKPTDTERFYVYAHVIPFSGLAAQMLSGSVIPAGTAFLRIAPKSANKNIFDHLHFGTGISKDTFPMPKDYVNPFFLAPIDPRDPEGTDPVIRAIYLRRPDYSTYFKENPGTVHGTVDVLADITDNMGAAIATNSDQVVTNDNVENEPDGWFSNSQRTACITGAPSAVAFELQDASGNIIHDNEFDFLSHDSVLAARVYGVENGEVPDDGKDAYINQNMRYRYLYYLTRLEKDEFLGGSWITNLKAGATDSTDLARLNSEAEFPDGKYTLKITAKDAEDHETTQDVDVVVDNFAPLLRSA